MSLDLDAIEHRAKRATCDLKGWLRGRVIGREELLELVAMAREADMLGRELDQETAVCDQLAAALRSIPAKVRGRSLLIGDNIAIDKALAAHRAARGAKA